MSELNVNFAMGTWHSDVAEAMNYKIHSKNVTPVSKSTTGELRWVYSLHVGNGRYKDLRAHLTEYGIIGHTVFGTRAQLVAF